MAPNDNLKHFFEAQEIYRRLEAIGERISQLASNIAVQAEREKYLAQEIAETNEKIEQLDKRFAKMERSALKTAGGFAVLMVLGTVAGFIIANVSTIAAFFKGFMNAAGP